MKSSEAKVSFGFRGNAPSRAGRGLSAGEGWPYWLRPVFWGFLAFFGKKPEKTGLAGMAHPPYGTNFLKRDGFLALNFSMARIFDQRPPSFNSDNRHELN
jgi:hypothetical protein